MKLAHKRASSPPLGLPPEWEKRLIDMIVTTLSSRDLAWADTSFISAMRVPREAARQIISRSWQAGLTESGKFQNQGRDLVKDVKRLQRAGLQVQGGFIVGFDSDTPAIFQRRIEFIQQSGIVTAMVGLLRALPGTGLYERMKRENRLRSDSTGDNVSASTNIMPRMGLEAIQEGYKHILRTIYSPENFYRRMKALLQD